MALARVHGSEAGASFDILARFESEDTRSHAEVMAPFAHAALQEAGVRGEELDAILTGTGPGPSPACAPVLSPRAPWDLLGPCPCTA